MLKPLLNNYAFNLSFLKMLVDDVEEEKMCQQPGGLVNHPAWTLPHLVTGSEFAGQLLGLEPLIAQDWFDKYGRGSTPSTDPADYPSKSDALAALEAHHARVSDALGITDPSLLDRPTPNDDFRQIMPTLGDALLFLLVTHEAFHIGELASWRKAMGLPPVME
jgi:hypothetical protein